MNYKSLFIIALRIAAIFIVVDVIEKFPFYYESHCIDGVLQMKSFLGQLVIPSTLLLFISALMWFYPDFLLKKVFLKEEVLEEGGIDVSELGALLISLIGLYILIYALADIVYHITFFSVLSDQLGNLFKPTPQKQAEMAATIAEIVFGFSLLFGSKFFTFLLLRLQKEIKKDL